MPSEKIPAMRPDPLVEGMVANSRIRPSTMPESTTSHWPLPAKGGARGHEGIRSSLSLASRPNKAALDGEDFCRRRASAQRRLSQRDDPKVRAGADAPQEVGGDEQRPADCLAMLLKPRRHVHRVAKIGDLASGIPAFADDHRARVQAGARPRGRAELVPIGLLAFLDPVPEDWVRQTRRFRQPQEPSRGGKIAWPRDLSKPSAFWAQT